MKLPLLHPFTHQKMQAYWSSQKSKWQADYLPLYHAPWCGTSGFMVLCEGRSSFICVISLNKPRNPTLTSYALGRTVKNQLSEVVINHSVQDCYLFVLFFQFSFKIVPDLEIEMAHNEFYHSCSQWILFFSSWHQPLILIQRDPHNIASFWVDLYFWEPGLDNHCFHQWGSDMWSPVRCRASHNLEVRWYFLITRASNTTGILFQKHPLVLWGLLSLQVASVDFRNPPGGV